MTLTQTEVRQLLRIAYANTETPKDAKDLLESAFDARPELGEIPQYQKAQVVENFLRATPGTWDVQELRKAITWLCQNWEDIPE
jgi:hypothetical protein